jgi:signal transduction histidine kinase
MMSFSLGLRLRVTLGFALIGAAVACGVGGWLYLSFQGLDQRLIDEALSAELQDYRARLARNPRSLPPMTATMRGYLAAPGRSSDVPKTLRGLPEGRFTRSVGGVTYRVAVQEVGGTTLFMLHRLHGRSETRRRQHWLLLFILGGTASIGLLSATWGWWLAGRVIAPVRELARRVRERRPEDLTTPLTAGLARDEVGELALAFERYLARLRAFVERERAFAADASHELRTPLAVVQGAVEVLQGDPQLDSRARPRVERIARAARAMAELTTALLMLARERPRTGPPPAVCNAAEVLREVLEQHQGLLQSRPVTLELEVLGEPHLGVEQPLLGIAIGNLVRNAFTYTESGRVHITLRQEELIVEDTGPGVPAKDLRRLFEHSDKARRATRGAGVGLPLVKRIADRQGWSLSVENREEGGARFRLGFSSAT